MHPPPTSLRRLRRGSTVRAVGLDPLALVSLALLALSLALSLAACGGAPSGSGAADAPDISTAPQGPPVILITFEGLRAAEVGALNPRDPGPSATPSLDALMAEADWAGRGVAAAPWAGSAGGSLATGLSPWKHQLLLPGERLAPELITLAEAFSALGFHTSGYLSGSSISSATGFQQGFDFFRTLRRGHGARSHLRGLQGGPELVWIHLQHPAPPWERRDWLFPDARVPPGVPARVDPAELSRWGHPSLSGDADDPVVPLPEGLRRGYQALYRNNVSLADVYLGRFLEDLRNSGHWDEIVLAVTSTHGQEVGEGGWVGEGGELSRRLLEVPLALKLPAASPLRPAVEPGQPVAAARLWATLVEAAGGRGPPGVAPSLFRRVPSPAVLSELYGAGGVNRFSLLEGEHQLVHRTRYLLPGSELDPRRAFRRTPPLTGPPGKRGRGGAVQRSLWLWKEESPVAGARRRLEDPALEARMHRRLLEAWSELLPAEEPPAVAAEDLSIGR